MHDKIRHFRVGLVTLVAACLFLGLVSFILGNGLHSRSRCYYILFEENVKGMVVGSKVNFQGVPVGAVKDIRFADGLTEVEISVDPAKATIQEETRARLDRLLVTGQVTVELEGYAKGSPELPDGAVIRPRQDPLHSLTTTLPETVKDITRLAGKIEGLVDAASEVLGERNRRHVASILESLDAAAARLPGRVDAVLSRAAAAASSAEEAIGRIGELGPGAAAAVAEARRAISSIDMAASSAGDLSGDIRELLAVVRGPVLQAVQSARGALDEVRGLARVLHLAPDSLIYGVSRPAAAPFGGRR